MCELTKRLGTEPREVYKVVAFKDGKIYSCAMGFEYKVGKVPIVDKQRKIQGNFATIKKGRGCFRKNLQGRTAGFLTEQTARFSWIFTMKRTMSWGYDPRIAKFTLSKALMRGNFECCPVIAGRYIDKIELLD